MAGTIAYPFSVRHKFSRLRRAITAAPRFLALSCPRRNSYNPPVAVDPSHPGRILAIDLGARTMGLALSDPLGVTAQGLPTLRRKNRAEDLRRLRELVTSHEVRLIVVGNPLHLSGDASASSTRAAGFAELLRRELGCAVELWDERLTTVEADRVLRAADLSRAKRQKAVDRLAATLLLQSYLDAHRSSQVPAHG